LTILGGFVIEGLVVNLFFNIDITIFCRIPKERFRLRLGITNRHSSVEVSRKILFRQFHPNSDVDAVLLRLDRPVNFRENISPICLPDSDDNFEGRTHYSSISINQSNVFVNAVL
jgi:hypothetical protein